MAEGKRILFYEPYFFDRYGNTRYLELIFKYLDRTRFDPILVTPDGGALQGFSDRKNARCIVCSTPRILQLYDGQLLKKGIVFKVLAAFSVFKHTASLVRIIHKEGVSLVQCHNLRSLITAGWAARFTGRPCIWYIKGELNNRWLDTIGFCLATRVMFLSESLRDLRYPLLRRIFREKVLVNEIGVDVEDVAAKARSNGRSLIEELGIRNSNVNLVFAGRTSEEKGLRYLLDALSIAAEKLPNIKLYVLGDKLKGNDTEFKDALLEIIRRSSLKDKVKFTGWRSDAHEIISLMDIYVLPSLSEGVPRSIVEAMVLRKPVIATRVGGIPELVRDGETGYLVEPKDVLGLADAIVKLAASKEARNVYGTNAAKLAREGYDIRRNILLLENVYNELTRN